ncbi:MAG: TRAM domain-containing protein [Candidatus Woesearchaeota archaeon]
MNDRFEKRSRFGHNDRQQFTPPVNVGDEIDVRIEAVGEKGDGVAKKDGFVLFVPNVNSGDYVRIKITKVLRKVGFAEKIGDAQAPEPTSQTQQEQEKPREKEAEPEEIFTPSEDDSEDFGEETDEETPQNNENIDDDEDETKN